MSIVMRLCSFSNERTRNVLKQWNSKGKIQDIFINRPKFQDNVVILGQFWNFRNCRTTGTPDNIGKQGGVSCSALTLGNLDLSVAFKNIHFKAALNVEKVCII